MTTKIKAVVTGGAGFIGSHVAEQLLKDGYEVAVIDNLSKGKRSNVPEGAQLFEMDILETEKMRGVFEGAAYVFHLAACPEVQYSIEHPLETHAINVTGTLSVLQAAKDTKVKRVVFASSCSVYGDQDVAEYTENLAFAPVSPYAAHKCIGEEYCRLFSRLYGLSTVCPRFFNVYGPRARDEGAYALVTGIFLRRRKMNEPLQVTGDGEQTRDFVHVVDVARAAIAAAISEKVGMGEGINIAEGRETSINSVAKLFGGPVTYLPARIEPRHALANIQKAKELLGWEPSIRLEDGIAELKKAAGLS
jgi:UDP-glucose 4-epimerase